MKRCRKRVARQNAVYVATTEPGVVQRGQGGLRSKGEDTPAGHHPNIRAAYTHNGRLAADAATAGCDGHEVRVSQCSVAPSC